MGELPAMQRRRDESLVTWLRDRSSTDHMTGLDATGWPASTWILHAMYERRDLPTDLTHNDVLRLRIERGEVDRTVIGSVDLAEESVATGVTLGWTDRPGAEWTRLLWTEQAARLGIVLGSAEVPPCHRWFPISSWPANVEPPTEGSLDAASLDGLLRCLSEFGEQGSQTRCMALYASVPSWEFDEVVLFEGPLSAIPSLVEGSQGLPGTPSNFWPEDQSWLVYTDWDLWATKVSGPASLISRLRSDPDLETLDWPARPPS